MLTTNEVIADSGVLARELREGLNLADMDETEIRSRHVH